MRALLGRAIATVRASCHKIRPLPIVAVVFALAPGRPAFAEPNYYKKLERDSTYVLSLHRGAKLIESLKAFQKATGVKFASVTGVGAVQNTKVSQFRFAGEDTVAGSAAHAIGQDGVVIEGRREIVSLTCILATSNFNSWEGESQAEPHCHIALAGSNSPANDSQNGFPAVGGHLFEADVGVIVDLVITTYITALTKTFDDELNGYVLDLGPGYGGTELVH